jgi:hypothetical protein
MILGLYIDAVSVAMDETGRELKSCKMWPIIRKCYVVFI